MYENADHPAAPTARPAGRRGLSRVAAAGIAVAVLGASALVGRRNAPDDAHPAIRRWYGRLRKPGFTPPDAVFGAVWPVLETGLAVGGYRLLRRPGGPAHDAAVGLWLVNAVMMGGWTELFFRRRDLDAGAAAASAMVATGVGYAAAASRVDRVAAATAVPFAAWLGFAALLAEGVRERKRA